MRYKLEMKEVASRDGKNMVPFMMDRRSLLGGGGLKEAGVMALIESRVLVFVSVGHVFFCARVLEVS